MRCIRKQHGFLMIEILVAVVIITIALVVVAGMFMQATQATSHSADYTAATAIAQDYLEQIKAGILTAPFATSYTETLNHINYTVAVRETVSVHDARLYQETVTVTWIQRGQSVSMSLTTFIVKNLPQFP